MRGAKFFARHAFFILQLEKDSHSSHALKCGDFWLTLLKKLISYDSKTLKLTERGGKHFQEVLTKIEPYLAVSMLLRSENVLKFAKVQAKFK